MCQRYSYVTQNVYHESESVKSISLLQKDLQVTF